MQISTYVIELPIFLMLKIPFGDSILDGMVCGRYVSNLISLISYNVRTPITLILLRNGCRESYT